MDQLVKLIHQSLNFRPAQSTFVCPSCFATQERKKGPVKESKEQFIEQTK